MFKKCILLATLGFFSVISAASTASAVDITQHLSIRSALENGKVKDALLPDVALYFAGDTHPPVVTNYGEFKKSTRTNTFMKDKIDSCDWAFASALLSLQQEALSHGGNAVIDITSNIKNRKNPSNTQYDCLVGGMMVNVAFHAKVVKLAK